MTSAHPLVRRIIRHAAQACSVPLSDPAELPAIDPAHPVLTELICLLSHVRGGLEPVQISTITNLSPERTSSAIHFAVNRLTSDPTFAATFHRIRSAA